MILQNLTSLQKSEAIPYNQFISKTFAYNFNDLIVYQIKDGEKEYYKISQEGNNQMYLVEQWANISAYEPGVETFFGIWRQCWFYLGKESIS